MCVYLFEIPVLEVAMKTKSITFTLLLASVLLMADAVSAATIGEIKALEENTPVALEGKVVTAGYGTYPYRIYIEEPDRSAGIQVYIAGSSLPDVTENKIVNVSGTIYTQTTGERAIRNATVTVVGTAESPIVPPMMANKMVGGEAQGLQKGCTGSIGVNNVGALVRTWGKVIYVDPNNWLKIDDGSGNPVQVDTSKLNPKPKLNDFIIVTGIVSCKANTPNPIAIIRPRRQDDVLFRNPTLQEWLDMPVPPNKLRIFWLGQAGFLFKDSEGRKVCVDLYLSDYCAQVPPNDTWVRLVPVPIPPENVQPGLTLCTHDHGDHTDPWTLQPICNSSSSLFWGPTSCYNHFAAGDIGIPANRRAVINRGQTMTWNGIQITAVYANHTSDSVGYIINMAGYKIYISGDTAYDTTLVDSVRAQHPDIMIVCINGKYGNMTYTEAAQLVKNCEPGVKYAIPMHYGMFAVNTEDPQNFVNACAYLGVTAQVIVMDFAGNITL
jgi:L-ascorbate 6-phosphate lactonase